MRINNRDQDDDATTVWFPRPPAASGLTGRRWIVAAAAAGVAVLLVAATGFWLSGGQDSETGTGTDAAAGLGSAQPGAGGQSTPDPAGSGGPDQDPPEGDGSGGEQEDGGGTGGSGAGPGNRPPVIDDPGLSSDGLLLRIAPAVTDPDGDDLTLLYRVFGGIVDPTRVCYNEPLCKGEAFPDGRRASFRFAAQIVGYRYDAEVTVIAIDDRGATTEETFTHTVEAVTEVTVSDIEFRLFRARNCFDATPRRSMTGRVELTGPVTATRAFSIEMSSSSPGFTLPVGGTSDVVGEEAALQVVDISVEFAGDSDELHKAHRSNTNQALALYSSSNPGRRADPDAADQARSNRSRFITLCQAATKSRTNFSRASSLA